MVLVLFPIKQTTIGLVEFLILHQLMQNVMYVNHEVLSGAKAKGEKWSY